MDYLSSMMDSFIFFGTPHVASETLAQLLAAGYVPKLVVTNPDRPQGRGLVMTPSPVRVLAESRGIPILMPEKLDDAAIASITAENASYALVVAYGKIIPERLITAFPCGVLNVHYSLLPKYRGASPLEAALLNGDTETGVTIQRMVYELDAGDILAMETTPIFPTETARELRPRLIDLGAKLLVATLPKYLTGEIVPVPQDASQATKCGKYKKEQGELILSPEHAEENYCKYRAFADSIGTYFFFMRDRKPMRIKIHTAEYVDGVFTPLRVTPEGKKETDYATFITAHNTRA